MKCAVCRRILVKSALPTMIIGPVCAKRMGFMDAVRRFKEPALPRVRKDRAVVLDGQMLLFGVAP